MSEMFDVPSTVARIRARAASLLAHSNGASLENHLLGTYRILAQWGQPPHVCAAGLVHSAYSTDIYKHSLYSLTDRAEVAQLVGPRAERLVYLFCILERSRMFESIDQAGAIPPEGLRMAAFRDVDVVEATAGELADLLLLHLANLADQAREKDSSPAIWMHRASQWALWIREASSYTAVVPPPAFAAASEALDIDCERDARGAYLEALRAMPEYPAAAAENFSLALAANPFIGEPRVWLAYLALRDGRFDAAWRWASGALAPFDQLGASWDKRLRPQEWQQLSIWLQEIAQTGLTNAALLKNFLPRIPAPPGRDFRQFVNEATAMALPSRGFNRFTDYVRRLGEKDGPQSMRYYPNLPRRPWHDPNRFPIVAALETAFPKIREELQGLAGQPGFHPESEPIKRTGSWDVFLLYELGKKNDGNCSLCPVTTQVVESHSTVRTLAGLIYFSSMAPGTHIAAHKGPTNIRLRCHLGIEVPDGCGIRVGDETRTWQEGKCIVFDDSFEHEAWNNSDCRRVVLVVDLWNPALDPVEIRLLNGLHQYVNFQSDSLHRYWAGNEKARGQGMIPD